MTDYRLPLEEIERYKTIYYLPNYKTLVAVKEDYIPLLLDAQIEHIRQQSGMKLISDSEILNSHIIDAFNPACMACSRTTTQAQLAVDQLVIDKRVAELEAQVKELSYRLKYILSNEQVKIVLEG